MPKYRKRPVVIEARQLAAEATDDEAVELARWCGGSYELDSDGSIKIPTLEGVMTVSDDDWIIKGAAGEFYPCKDAIFRATYEMVEG